MSEGNGNNGDGPKPGVGIVVSPKAVELDLLALKLKLSPQQKAFAIHLVADPIAGYTAAAEKAGSKSPARIGWRWSKLPKVIEYMEAIRVASGKAPIAIPEVLTPTILTHSTATEIDNAIATETEALRGATALRRAKMGHFMNPQGHIIVSRVRKAAPGVVKRYRERILKVDRTFTTAGESSTERTETTLEREIELVDGIGAHALLGKFLGMDKRKIMRRIARDVRTWLRSLPDSELQKLRAASAPSLEKG